MPTLTKPDMIYRTAFDTETGAVRWVAFGVENLMVFPEEPGLAWVDGEWDAKTHYIDNGEAVSRPGTGLPETHQVSAGADWSLPDVPEGTLVQIDGEEAGTVDATGLTLSFALAGVWRVDLKPPFPWVEASSEVTVI